MMMFCDRLTPNKELRELIAKCRENGVTVTKGRKHLRFHTPEGYYYAACTPSDRRAIKHVLAALRRMGCEFLCHATKGGE